SVQTRWRAEADARRSARAASPVTARTSDARTTASTTIGGVIRLMDLHSALPRGVDQAREAIQFGGREPRRAVVEQRRDRLLRRPVEEGLQDVLKSRPLRVVARDRRHVEIARTVLLVADMALFLEDAEERPDGRIARRFGQGGLDFGCGGLAPLIKD